MSALTPLPDRPLIRLIDPTPKPWSASLAAELRAKGFELDVVRSADTLGVSPVSRRLFVVAYSPPPSVLAEETLAAVSHCLDPTVVVLVDESDFSHYYGLMSLGARGYFALSEGVDTIARALAIMARDRIEPFDRLLPARRPRLLPAAPAAA